MHDWVQAGNLLEDAVTVVNTTALGMTGKPEFRVPLDALNPRALVTDLVYTPLRTTQFLIAGRGSGLHRRRRAGHAAASGRAGV